MTLVENKPASSRRRPPRTPKGRQVDPDALDEVRGLLGERERRRDLLIDHLHLIQDKYGHLSAAHLVALAQEMKLALTEVYEVATFYAHFDVVKDAEQAPPTVTVRVCDSLSCAMAGAAIAYLALWVNPGIVRSRMDAWSFLRLRRDVPRWGEGIVLFHAPFAKWITERPPPRARYLRMFAFAASERPGLSQLQ